MTGQDVAGFLLAKYSMIQSWARIWAPVFDNPWLCYCIDQYVDWGLRWYYYPIQLALDLQEIRDLVQGSNLCQPQQRQTSYVEPADVELKPTST